MIRRLLALIAALTLWVGVARAAEAPIPPVPERWVTDTVGVLSPPKRAALDAELEGYERAHGHQVVVWIGDSIGDAPLDDWAVRTFAAWKLGRAGQDDGIALFLLKTDRKADIEVGYGLEALVPDITANRIIQDTMAPRLRDGDWDSAVQGGVDALLTAIEGQAPPAAGAEPPVAPEEQGELSLPELILLGIAGVIVLAFLITHPRFAMFLLWTIGRGGGGRGGDGGFRGGGGRSGGGGARGGW